MSPQFSLESFTCISCSVSALFRQKFYNRDGVCGSNYVFCPQEHYLHHHHCISRKSTAHIANHMSCSLLKNSSLCQQTTPHYSARTIIVGVSSNATKSSLTSTEWFVNDSKLGIVRDVLPSAITMAYKTS